MKRLGTCFQCLALLLCFVILASSLSEKEILLQFKGNISSDPFNSLSSWDPSSGRIPCQDFSGVSCNSAGNVEKIVLWNTNLSGILAPVLSGLKSLRTLNLFGNRFSGNVPSEYGGIDTLWKINLSSNALSGSIPEFLGKLPNIRFLDLSNNAYTGDVPSALFSSCFKTRFVSFKGNSLSGTIPVSIANCMSLEGLDLSYNSLSGGLPPEICSIPGLLYLSLRSNSLSGSVQEQISSCRKLEFLDLGSNLFSGLAPFGVLGLPNFQYLNISHNVFEQELPEISTCSESLEYLDIAGNKLSGKIPSSIAKCSGLKYVDFSYNKLTGSIPIEFANLKMLLVIRLASNSIGGTIPKELGSIEWLQALDLHNLNIGGEIPEEITNCRFLLQLDVSGNSLRGEIPQNLYNMSYLLILDLHQNQLNGSIPSTLGNLSNLHSLDLSQNLLSGQIPSTLENLKNLTHFNVSHNLLFGPIPSAENIQKFGPSAFIANAGLCGAPLDTSCSGNTAKKPKLSTSAIIAIVAAALILTGVCIISVMNIRAHGRRRGAEREEMVVESTPLASTTGSNVIIGKLVLFSKTLPSKYEDWEAGTKALLDKECLIGGGTIGTVYKTTFEGDSISIAVKKLETLGRIRNQDEFENEIGRLGNLKHPNLVSFQGYYWSSNMQLVITEFIPNGNLYDNLHGLSYPGTSTGVNVTGNPELTWSRRFQIALGISRAISYLHNDCRPQILHLNIKSTNILLDNNYEPKLSDYGFGKLLPMLDHHGMTRFHNAVGYVAPELAQSMRLTDRCDVFSFGVILLELVTGKKPVESPNGHEVVVLCEYVRMMVERGAPSDCFDRSLRGLAENEVVQVMKLGLICTSEAASKRPSMAEVVQFLESIRIGLGSYHGN